MTAIIIYWLCLTALSVLTMYDMVFNPKFVWIDIMVVIAIAFLGIAFTKFNENKNY